MKPLNELLSSLCSTAGVEYREREGTLIKISEEADPPEGLGSFVRNGYFCEMIKDDKVIFEGFSSHNADEGITETTKETAREWLLYSLITKAINQ